MWGKMLGVEQLPGHLLKWQTRSVHIPVRTVRASHDIVCIGKADVNVCQPTSSQGPCFQKLRLGFGLIPCCPPLPRLPCHPDGILAHLLSAFTGH